MSIYTSESTLPSSTLNSDSHSSSQSVSSSGNEQLDRSLDWLDYSWPLSRDRTVYTAELENTGCTTGRRNIGCTGQSDWKATNISMFRPSSRNSSAPSPRQTRQDHWGSEGCSPDASALYGNSGKHYNPSGSGQHAYQEMSEYFNWANSYLQYSSHNTFITDLTRDLADGQTLLHLVEELLGVPVNPIHVKPALEVQKIENIQRCLDVLTRHGIPVQEVFPEDIVEQNTKVILVLCKCLRNHFGSSAGSRGGSSEFLSSGGRTPSSKPKHVTTVSPRAPYTTKHDKDSRTSIPTSCFPLMDGEDVALIDWVRQMTGQAVEDYSCFQDGHILCLLVNKLTDGAVPGVVLEYGLPSEKVSLALMFAEEELDVPTDLSSDEVMNLSDNVEKIASFLKALRQVFLKQERENQYETETELIINEQVKRFRGSMVQEHEANIEQGSVCRQTQKDLRNSFYGVASDQGGRQLDMNVLYSGKVSEKDNSVFTLDKMSPKSQGRETSEKRNHTTESNFPSHLKDSINEIPRDNILTNHIGDTSYLEELSIAVENSYRISSTPQKSIFDSVKLKLRMMPHATKSWQKERENAKLRLVDLSSQLQCIKEEYFRLMNMKVQRIPDENENGTLNFAPETISTGKNSLHLNLEPSTVDHASVPRSTTPEALVRNSRGQLANSSCLLAYSNVKKGTLPPYRTWSRYKNTEGDRYRYCYKKKTLNLDKRTNATMPRMSESEVTIDNQNDDGSTKTMNDYQDHQKELAKYGSRSDKSLISPEERKAQEINSRDKDDRQSVSSQKISGKPLYGMTAVVRLSSKKANAVSDTDS